MSQDEDTFQVALATDLQRVYRDGLPKRIATEYVPAMTELAEVISGERFAGEEDYYSLQVENLLREAIGRLPIPSERLKGRTISEHRQGLEKLFGIAGERVLGLEARRENAADLLGYGGAATLRRGEANKRPLNEVLLEELRTQMQELATGHGFEYTARYGRHEPLSETEPDGHKEDSDPSNSIPVPIETTASSPAATPLGRTMRWRRLGWRWQLVAAIGVTLLLGAATLIVTGALASHRKYLDTWGPNRLMYDYARYNGNGDCNDPANPATYYGRCGAITTYPVFNSFINLPFYRDEAEFFDGYRAERAAGNAEDPVRDVTRGNRIVVLQIHIDNMAKVDEKEPALTTAYNTRVRVSLPTNTSNSLIADAYISANRAITVNDSVDLGSDRPFSLEYIPGSAVLYNSAHGHSQSHQLSNEIIGSEGAIIGVGVINGVLPPSFDFSTAVTVELKVRATPQSGTS
jgi:hypothetical protein